MSSTVGITAASPSSSRSASTSRSSPIPRDALTRTVSPSRRRGRRASSAASASATWWMRRRLEAGRGGPVDDPAGVRAPTTISSSATARRGLADRAVARLVAVAELEHLAEHGHVAAGQPGQQVERGDASTPARRCSCRR